jgi:hypothetical protein
MVQMVGLANNGQTAAIPLYQKGFNWIKYWIGFCFATCLCLLLAAAITFTVLYILAQTGVIKSINNNGRIITNSRSSIQTSNDTYSLKDTNTHVYENNNNNNNIIESNQIVPKSESKYDKFKSKYVNFRYA